MINRVYIINRGMSSMANVFSFLGTTIGILGKGFGSVFTLGTSALSGVANVFGGLSSKLVAYLVIGLVVIILIGGGVFAIRVQARHEQLLKDQAVQLQQVVKTQNDFIKHTNDILDAQKQANDNLNNQVSIINKNNQKINTYLNSD